MTTANDVEAPSITEFVFEFTSALPAVIAAAIDVDAVVTSDTRAKDPDVSVPSVRFRVANVHTSLAVRLAEVRVRVPLSQTSAASVPNVVSDRVGLAQIAPGRVEYSEVDALSTVALVFALMTAARDVDAASMVAFVFAFTAVLPAVIAEASDDDAFVVSNASDDEALPTTVFVFVFTAVAIPET